MDKRILLFGLILIMLSAVAAQQEVTVGTYVLNVGEYNIEAGSYRIDFYLWLKWDPVEDAITPDTFEFMNGRASDKELLIEEPGYLFYRIEASLYEPSNLENFPVDTQKVTIKLEDSVHTTEDIIYVPDTKEIGIDDEFRIMGWEYRSNDVTILEEHYPNWNESYSRYVHEIVMERPASTLYKSLIPFFFILLSAWACFFLPMHKLGERLALCGTALLSSVVFHLYLTEQIPPVGYLILADKIAISMYSMLVFTIIAIAIIERTLLEGDKKDAEKLNKIGIIASLFVPVIIFLLLGGL